ncbi:MAG TPA: ATP-binding protein [Burkholderiaceae bacterium]|nr:ATP-binding protein [Burkholderiaceae bacterium]
MNGIRSRLLLLLGVLIVAASGIQFAATFSASLAQTNRLFDAQLLRIARTLGQMQGQVPEAYREYPLEYDLVIQRWRHDEMTVYQQREHRELPGRAALGYSTVTMANGEWRIYAAAFEGGLVQVAQKMSARRQEAIALALNTLWPILLMAVVLLGAMWWLVSVALRPLAAVQQQIAQRDANALEQVDCSHAPREIMPLIDAINELLRKVRDAIASQRQFVADAAHELRSPLTVLQVQIQMLGRSQPEAARKASLAALGGAVARSSRMVEQLLGLARQDALSQASAGEASVDLVQYASAAIAEVAPFASGKGVELSFLDASPVAVRADADSLMILLRNLLDNAVRYTPPHGAVTIGVERRGTQGVLTIADSGPGIPPADLARVTDRFYRVPGTTENGSGLGLAIVQAVVTHLGAALELRNSAHGGLVVKVLFRPAPP